jgi:hypothetical protein
MSVHLKCERCGFQEQTSGVMLLAGTYGPGIPVARPELPDGWARPRLPNEDGSADERELCPGCKADLFAFMRGAAVPGREPDADLPHEAQRSAVCQACGRCPDCGVHHDGEGCGSPPRKTAERTATDG